MAATAAGSVSADGPPIPQFTAEYEVHHGSLHVANARFTLDHRDGESVFRSVTKPRGLISVFRNDVITETSHFRFDNGLPQPRRYTYVHEGSSKDRNRETRFDWNDHTAVTEYRGETMKLDIPEPTFDRLSAQLAASLYLIADRVPDEIRIADRDELDRYKVIDRGTDTVKTPAGNFRTRHLIQKKDDRTTVFQLAEKDWYLPVIMEKREPDEDTIRLELKSLQYGEPKDAGSSD